MRYILSILVILVIILSSCKNDNDSNGPVIDYGYYPIDTGRFVVYDVQEIVIDSAAGVYDTTNYQIKEVFESHFIDIENRLAVRIERYKRKDSLFGWEIKDVWYANRLTGSVQVVEENIRFVKIIFPVTLSETWDGNNYNTESTEEYEITGIDESWSINQLDFDSVLTVTQLLDSTLIYKYHKEEKYAKNIGLIYKIDLDINSQNLTYPWVLVEDRPTKATMYRQKIIDYGWN